MLLALLEPQLRQCKALAPAFVTYDGALEGSDVRTSTYLCNAGRREVSRQQKAAVAESLLKRTSKAAPALPGA
eukprot:6372879-Pyramimonas_sp.AAC.1